MDSVEEENDVIENTAKLANQFYIKMNGCYESGSLTSRLLQPTEYDLLVNLIDFSLSDRTYT